MFQIKDPQLQDDLLVLEEQEGAVNFKIGVLFAKTGQVTDDEMFSNEHPSPEFEQFYRTLGTVKELNVSHRTRTCLVRAPMPILS